MSARRLWTLTRWHNSHGVEKRTYSVGDCCDPGCSHKRAPQSITQTSQRWPSRHTDLLSRSLCNALPNVEVCDAPQRLGAQVGRYAVPRQHQLTEVSQRPDDTTRVRPNHRRRHRGNTVDAKMTTSGGVRHVVSETWQLKPTRSDNQNSHDSGNNDVRESHVSTPPATTAKHSRDSAQTCRAWAEGKADDHSRPRVRPQGGATEAHCRAVDVP